MIKLHDGVEFINSERRLCGDKAVLNRFFDAIAFVHRSLSE